MENIDLLSALASEPRLEILKLLADSDLKSAQIAKKLSISLQALTRHTEKLSEAKLIEKTTDGYKLSSIAKVSLMQIPFFEFLSKNHKYFANHDFTGVPPHLVARIGELAESKLEPEFMKSIQTAREFCIDAKKSIYAATCTMPMELFDILLEKNKDFEWHNAFGKNTIVAKGFSKYPARKKCFEKFNGDKFKEKIIQNIPIICAVTENACQFMFANKEMGQCDMEEGVFFGTDQKSIQWCKELVDYYWNQPEIKGFTIKEQ